MVMIFESRVRVRYNNEHFGTQKKVGVMAAEIPFIFVSTDWHC